MAHAQHYGGPPPSRSLNRTALSATVHCLTGCAIGEVIGMVVGTGLGLDTWTTVVLSVALASLFASLVIAGAAAFPLNRWLIRRGMGHAVLHTYHQ